MRRERKLQRTGICVDCGGKTAYNGNRRRPDDGVSDPASSLRCVGCSSRLIAAANIGQGKRQRQLLAYLAENRTIRWSEVTVKLGVKKPSVGNLIGRLMKNGLIVQADDGTYRLP